MLELEDLRKYRNKGQATLELAIMGAVVIMLLGYLLSSGYLYNSRQSLEMYTFRKALELSREQERGISLITIRDVVIPSFFSGISRQRLTSSSSVEVNPWKLYEPDVPQDVGTKQLLQIGEEMIRNDVFIEVPPTKTMVKTNADEEERTQWMGSAIRNIAPQSESTYIYSTGVLDNAQTKSVEKFLESQDRFHTQILFETAEKIENDMIWDNEIVPEGDKEKISKFSVIKDTIPRNITFTLNERLRREKQWSTPHE